MPRELGMIIGGKYRICRVIGRGAASCVYLAEDIRLGAKWAVKEVFPGKMADEKRLAGVIAEACLLKSLNHPALPRIVDLIYGEQSILIIMDFIDGRPLDRVLASEGPPDAVTAMDWTVQIAEILDYLHNQDPPVIYRDLKPANLILDGSGRIRMIDFNAARRYRPGKTRDTEPLGTRGYAPPEQYGTAQTDARSDLFALGVMIGQFCGSDRTGILFEASRRCSENDPDDRFQSAAELISFLKGKDGRTVLKRRPVSIRLVLLTLAASAVFLIGGIFFRALSAFTIESAYRHALIMDRTATPEEREERLYEAIRMKPENPDAYLALITFYENRRSISEKQSRRLRSCLLEHASALKIPDIAGHSELQVNRGLSGMQVRDAGSETQIRDDGSGIREKSAEKKIPARSGEILYRAALLHFFAYRGSGGSLSDAAGRALSADFFFSPLAESSPADQKAGRIIRQSVCFHQICSFLSEYVSNLSYLSAPDASAFAELLSAAEGCVDSVVSGEIAPTQYAALSLLSEISGVLCEYREGIAADNENAVKLQALMDKMENDLSCVQPDTGRNRALLENVEETVRDIVSEMGEK